MFYRTLSSTAKNPPLVIICLKRCVVIFSLVYVILQELYFENLWPWRSTDLFFWEQISFFGYLIKSSFASFVIPYPHLSWSIAWDFILLNIFYAPVLCFIVSFVGQRSFLIMWMLFAYVASSANIIGTLLFPSSCNIFTPYSTFSNVAFAMMIFWIGMLRTSKSTPNAFFVVPVATEWIALIAAFLCIIAPLTQGAYAHATASCVTGICAYFYAITRWHMKSNIIFLQGYEEKMKDFQLRFQRFWQWSIMRSVRALYQTITNILSDKRDKN